MDYKDFPSYFKNDKTEFNKIYNSLSGIDGVRKIVNLPSSGDYIHLVSIRKESINT